MRMQWPAVLLLFRCFGVCYRVDMSCLFMLYGVVGALVSLPTTSNLAAVKFSSTNADHLCYSTETTAPATFDCKVAGCTDGTSVANDAWVTLQADSTPFWVIRCDKYGQKTPVPATALTYTRSTCRASWHACLLANPRARMHVYVYIRVYLRVCLCV
jgi:hypothetical protein